MDGFRGRNFLNELPFRGLNAAQFQVVQGAMRDQIRGAPVNIRRRLVNDDEMYATPFASAYRETWDFQVPVDTELELAILSVHNEMIETFADNAQARVRVWYNDQQAVVYSSTRTRVFENIDQFIQDGLWAIHEALMFLLTSNDILDFENLHFLMDLSVPALVGGGSDGTCLPQYRECKALMQVPQNCNYLCGWICLALFFLKFYPDREIGISQGIPSQLYDLVETGRYTLTTRLLSKKSKMIKAAQFLISFVGSPRQAFTPAEDYPLISAKWPWLKLVIMDGNEGNVRQSFEPDIWPPENADPGKLENYVCYMHYEFSCRHYCLIEDVHKHTFAGAAKNLSRYKYCHVCLKSFNRHGYARHACTEFKCDKCCTFFETLEQLKKHQDPEADLPETWLPHFPAENFEHSNTKCGNCLMVCHNFECLKTHQRVSRCSDKYTQRRKCPNCQLVIFNNAAPHNCDPGRKITCTNCAKKYKACEKDMHRCFIKTLDPPEEIDVENEGRRYYAFDFESQFLEGPLKLVNTRDGQVEEIRRDLHDVNFVCVRQCFTENRWSFANMTEFTNWISDHLKSDEDDAEEVVMIAHNLKGYDGRLLFDYYIKQLKTIPTNVLWNGTKIMAMTIRNVTYRDSVLHMATSLANLPKIFGLDEEKFAKGFFPYKFNRPENQAYVGDIPAINFFEPEMMMASKRKEFLAWYQEQQGKVYNFREELERYCISDVDILAESLEVYMREGMLMNSDLNPMAFTTIASYAFAVYRTLHMPADTLAVLTKREIDFAKNAMHGGRTDVRQMLKQYSKDQVEAGIYAKYQDVQSLYPYVQFFKELPCGVPEIFEFTDENQPAEIGQDWFGFVECDIEPPNEYLHHPVIVGKRDGKLMADLLPKERKVLTTPELRAALDKGYVVKKVYEYHKYKPSNTLFTSYLQQYLKIKIQCSGMPGHIKNEQDWEEFREYHENVLGIVLDRSAMCKNAGKKQIAKLMLNSLWGKFAESKNYTQHAVVTNPTELRLYEVLWDTCKLDIMMTMNVAPNKYIFIYKNISDSDLFKYDIKRASKSNIALASFVTAWGALILWEQMDKLGQRVLYHDTDSIIYEHQPNAYNIPEGKYLGEWEDECGGQAIVKFASTGPKTYSYAQLEKPVKVTAEQLADANRNLIDYWYNDETEEMQKMDYTCKCKGFSLNSYNSSQVNYSTLQSLILGNVPWLKTKALKFYWDRLRSQMTSAFETKFLTFKYDKGVIDKRSHKVYPFGYEKYGDFDNL